MSIDYQVGGGSRVPARPAWGSPRDSGDVSDRMKQCLPPDDTPTILGGSCRKTSAPRSSL